MVHVHTCRQNTDTHKIKFKNNQNRIATHTPCLLASPLALCPLILLFSNFAPRQTMTSLVRGSLQPQKHISRPISEWKREVRGSLPVSFVHILAKGLSVSPLTLGFFETQRQIDQRPILGGFVLRLDCQRLNPGDLPKLPPRFCMSQVSNIQALPCGLLPLWHLSGKQPFTMPLIQGDTTHPRSSASRDKDFITRGPLGSYVRPPWLL